jgi:hypothetical protein
MAALIDRMAGADDGLLPGGCRVKTLHKLAQAYPGKGILMVASFGEYSDTGLESAKN